MLNGTDIENRLTGSIIGAALVVHKTLGPGLLENTYLTCLKHELELAGLKVQAEHMVALKYRDLLISRAYRIDLLVEDSVVVEVKAVEKLQEVHHSQLLTYLRLMEKRVGILLNFNIPKLPDGIKRIRNDR